MRSTTSSSPKSNDTRYTGYGKRDLIKQKLRMRLVVNESTVCRELRRNRRQLGWRPKQAQELRDNRCQVCNRAKGFGREDWNKVDKLIRQDMSPEQASARFELDGELSIRRASTSTLTPTNGRVVSCGGIYAARNYSASGMPVDLIVVTPSVTGSALMNVQRSYWRLGR